MKEGPAPVPQEPGEPKNSYLDYIKKKQGEIKAELDAKEQPAPQPPESTGQRASVSRRGALSFGPVQHTGEPRVDAEGNVFHPIDQKSHEYLERVRATQEDARRQIEGDLAAQGGASHGEDLAEYRARNIQAGEDAKNKLRQMADNIVARREAGGQTGSEAAPAPKLSPEEIARQEREKKDNLMLYRIVSGDRQAKEVPANFEATQETKEAAERFFRSRDGLLDAYKKEFTAKRAAKKSGYEQGGAATAEAIIWRENAQLDYEKKLEGLKKELLEDFIEKKHEKYPNLSKKEMQEETLKYSAGFILETAKDIDMDLEAEKNRVAYETKEKGIASKLWEKYTKAPKWKKWAIGAAVAGVVGLGGALLFPSTLLFAGSAATLSKVGVGGFLAGKAARSITGGALGAGIFSGLEKFHIRRKYGKKRAEAGASQQAETLEKLRQEIGTAEDWLENEEIKMKMMTIVDADAIEYRKKLDKIANKEGRSRLYAALAAGIIGGAAATAAGLDWSQVFPGGPKGAALVGALENKPSGGGVGAYEGLEVESGPDNVPSGDGLEVESGPDNLPPSPEKIISGLETARPGDSVWRMAERQLEQRIPGFNELNEAQRTYLIDAIKDKIAEDPGKFGLVDPDKLAIGQKIDFSSIFEKDSDLQELVDKARGLSQAQMENIVKNNATIRDWMKDHPGEALTSDKVDEILRGGGGDEVVGVSKNQDFNKEPPSAEFTPGPGEPAVEDVGAGNEGDVAKAPEGGVKPDTPVFETLPKVSEFGTQFETAIGEKFGFSADQFEVTKGLTVEKLLAAIPIDKDAQVGMWENFSKGNPPDLWPSEKPYYSSILQHQVQLAEFLWQRFPRPDIDPDLQKLTIGEVINRLHLEVK